MRFLKATIGDSKERLVSSEIPGDSGRVSRHQSLYRRLGRNININIITSYFIGRSAGLHRRRTPRKTVSHVPRPWVLHHVGRRISNGWSSENDASLTFFRARKRVSARTRFAINPVRHDTASRPYVRRSNAARQRPKSIAF